MTWRSHYGRVAVASFLFGLTLIMCIDAGCASSPHSAALKQGTSSASVCPERAHPAKIVAVERVYGDLAHQIVWPGPGTQVTTLVNSPSADPHAYEPTTADADAIAGADLVIENGLGYDAFVDKLIAASPNASRTVIVVGNLEKHLVGDNPHVWYEATTLTKAVTAIADWVRCPYLHPGLNSGFRDAASLNTVDARARTLLAWTHALALREGALGARHRGARVAITEPVFDYVLRAAKLTIATPTSFSHAIEEGNDPAPQDVDAMRALLSSHGVAAFVYNRQTVEPSTERLLAIAQAAHVPIVPVTETLPAGEDTEHWIDGEISALDRAL